jgi:hypothetical protein
VSIFAAIPQRAPFLRVLAYGSPGTDLAGFALSFPDPAIVTFTRSISFARLAPHARAAIIQNAHEIAEITRALQLGQEQIGTLVLYDFSRVYDRINAALAHESRDAFYRKRQEAVATLVRGTEGLQCHVVITAREKPLYAEPGTLIGERVVGPNDMVPIGSAPDLDRTTEHDVDVALRFTRTDAGKETAIVTKSFLPEIPVGAVIDDPSFAALAILLSSTIPEPGPTPGATLLMLPPPRTARTNAHPAADGVTATTAPDPPDGSETGGQLPLIEDFNDATLERTFEDEAPVGSAVEPLTDVPPATATVPPPARRLPPPAHQRQATIPG